MIQIENYLPLVHTVARKYQKHSVDYDELVSLGIQGLYDALENYDPAKASFGTYAEHWIRGRILNSFTTETRRHKLGKSYYCEEELEDRLVDARKSLTCDSIICPEQAMILTNQNEILYKHLAELSTREIRILRARYLHHEDDILNYKDLAKEFGVSFQRIMQIENRALEKLRQSLCA